MRKYGYKDGRTKSAAARFCLKKNRKFLKYEKFHFHAPILVLIQDFLLVLYNQTNINYIYSFINTHTHTIWSVDSTTPLIHRALSNPIKLINLINYNYAGFNMFAMILMLSFYY